MSNSPTNSIWMISSSFYPWIGGAERQLQRISKLLLAHDWPLRVLTRRHRKGFPENLPATDIVDSVPVIRLYSRGRSKISSLLYILGGLWYLICHGRGGIYHAHGPGAPAWLAVIAQYLLRGRSIIKVRNGTYIYTRLYLSSWWRSWLFVIPLRLATRVLVVSKDGAHLMHKLGVPAARVVHIPNGVDTDQFHPASPETKIICRQQLNLPTDKTIVLYVGRLNLATKDVDTLLHAWATLANDVQDSAMLVIVGQGPDRKKLERLSSSLGINTTVVFAGAQQKIREYYWAADVFTLASRDEGLSNALLEAMACGLPVVSSNVGGTPDVVEEAKNGFLYEAQNYHQLAQKLTILFHRQIDWNKMGTIGRQIVSSYASLSNTSIQLDELYNELLN